MFVLVTLSRVCCSIRHSSPLTFFPSPPLTFPLATPTGFLKYLKHAKIPLNEYDFPSNKIAKVQTQLEALVSKNYYLHKSAREAYRSYLQSYAQNGLKHIFDVHKLDLLAVAKSFGFTAPPKVHLKISLKTKTKYEDESESSNPGVKGRSRHGYDRNNPYGQTSSTEQVQALAKAQRKQKRQWSR